MLTYWFVPFAGILKNSCTENSVKIVVKVLKLIFAGYVYVTDFGYADNYIFGYLCRREYLHKDAVWNFEIQIISNIPFW